MIIDLTNAELFKDLTSIDQDNIVVDLHNDYQCINLSYELTSKSLNITFKSKENLGQGKNLYCLFFKEVTVVKFNLFFCRTIDTSTINIFYRGRFEKDGKLIEQTSQNEKYYYIEFEKGDKFELFSKEVLFDSVTAY